MTSLTTRGLNCGLRDCVRGVCLTFAVALFGLMVASPRAAALSTGAISGTVTGVYTDVHLIDVGGPNSAVTCTGADGSYTFSNVPPGTDYRVLFASDSGVRMADPCPGGVGYHPQFYNDKQSLESADPIVVTAGNTTTGIDAVLLLCSTVISGVVTDASTHAPVQGATVSEYYGVGDVDQTTTTDGSGAYELTVIGGAFIRVGFAAPGYVSQFYNGKPSLASADFIRTAFTCGFTSQPSISAGIDAALAPSVPPLTNPPPATPTVPLALSAVRESHRNWRRNGTPPRTTIVGRTPIGTTFRFNLNEAARMRFVFTQPLSGRMMGGRCVAQTSKNRRRHACTRSVARGALSFSGHPGLNKVVFQGRLSRSRTLTPGRYMLIIVATDAAGQRATARLTFTIVG